ncbi:lipase family protein [Gordonia zhaorongruii]|uniref:lipase family protein n=1 Tax=Gordonia zhaorongruii TaxID=2597659 RepID=UPI001643087D|nr:lipase family protein [Gordonia zhaorongruii]
MTVALVGLMSLGAIFIGAGTSHAEGGFYTVPKQLTGAPGDVLRSEPMTVALSVPTPSGHFPADASRIMYRTTGPTGQPAAATGTVLTPKSPWRGRGSRPLVSFTVGTHGIGPQCKTSRLLGEALHYTPPLDFFVEYELPSIYMLLSQGIAVVVTDYLPDTYLNPRGEGPATIDAARAAQRLPGAQIPADGPVAFWGYSQGGHSAAAAAEQVSAYAPELNVKGAFVGAPPVDMIKQLGTVDGGALVGINGYFLNGLMGSYPATKPVIDDMLNRAGHEMLRRTDGQCVVETELTYGLRKSSELTVSGRSIQSVLASDRRTAKVIDSMTLGRTAPSTPILLLTGGADDIVSPAAVRRLGHRWCAGGTSVQLMDIPLPKIFPGLGLGHIVNMPIGELGQGFSWLNDRFNGRTAPSNCR